MTLVRTGIETMFAEMTEDLSDMLLVFCRVVGVDEDVVKVDGNINVEEVAEDVIHESLEGGVRGYRISSGPLTPLYVPPHRRRLRISEPSPDLPTTQ